MKWIFLWLFMRERGWSGGVKVLCILHHQGVQLTLAYSWARPATLVAGKGRGRMFLFLLFLHFHSCSAFFPVPLIHLLYYLFSPSLTKWPTRIDVWLNPNRMQKKKVTYFHYRYTVVFKEENMECLSHNRNGRYVFELVKMIRTIYVSFCEFFVPYWRQITLFTLNTGTSGPSCSKLTMSLVNVSLKFWSLNMAYTLIFLLKKMWVAFAFAKATHIFSAKNNCELDILLTRTVIILTINELVKLTMLWTTGPWTPSHTCLNPF